MHFRLCHLVTLGSQVVCSRCLLQYSPGHWSLDLLCIQDKALFYSLQRPYLGSDDRSGHCAEQHERGFQQYCMAMLSIVGICMLVRRNVEGKALMFTSAIPS
jgi:hypothetical protein